MMRITSVEKNNRAKGQYSIYIDDSFAFSVPEDEYFRLNLYEERDIDSEELKNIMDTVVFNSAKNSAVRYLSLKLKTENEVRKKLRDERYDNATVDRVIEELKAIGYINSRLYIQKFIYDRNKLKPQSKKLLRYELMNRGLPSDEIDEALNDLSIDEVAIAENLVKKKFGKYDISDKNVANKVFMFLKHRGYGRSVTEEVFRRLVKET
jgi:regulatory protein